MWPIAECEGEVPRAPPRQRRKWRDIHCTVAAVVSGQSASSSPACSDHHTASTSSSVLSRCRGVNQQRMTPTAARWCVDRPAEQLADVKQSSKLSYSSDHPCRSLSYSDVIDDKRHNRNRYDSDNEDDVDDDGDIFASWKNSNRNCYPDDVANTAVSEAIHRSETFLTYNSSVSRPTNGDASIPPTNTDEICEMAEEEQYDSDDNNCANNDISFPWKRKNGYFHRRISTTNNPHSQTSSAFHTRVFSNSVQLSQSFPTLRSKSPFPQTNTNDVINLEKSTAKDCELNKIEKELLCDDDDDDDGQDEDILASWEKKRNEDFRHRFTNADWPTEAENRCHGGGRWTCNQQVSAQCNTPSTVCSVCQQLDADHNHACTLNTHNGTPIGILQCSTILM